MLELPQNIIKVQILNIFEDTYTEGLLNLNLITYTEYDKILNVTRIYLLNDSHPILIKGKL